MIRSEEQHSVKFCLCLSCVLWGLRNAAFVSNKSNSHRMLSYFYTGRYFSVMGHLQQVVLN